MIDADVVRHVARLSRLALDDAEVETMRAEMSTILEHVDSIQALELDDVVPTTHVIHVENVLRADDPGTSLPHDIALREAPRAAGGGFSVGRIG